ncbi:EH_Signature domain-containing protein [Gammaproteobacteria bacterium]
MSISDAVREARSSWQPLKCSLPSVSKTEQKMLEIVTAPPRPPPLPVDLNDLHARLVVSNTDGNWGRVEPVEWRYASECLSMGQTPLVSDDWFVKNYLSILDRLGSPVIVKRLVRYYLVHYNRKLRGFHRIAEYLAMHAGDCGVWGERHNQYLLFDIDAAPYRLAAAVVDSKVEPHRFLKSVGFTGTLANSSFMAATFRVACQTSKDCLEKGNCPGGNMEELRRLVSWIDAGLEGKMFPFGGFHEVKSAFAEAMTLPWQNRTPSDEVREFNTSTLLSFFKDPRIARSNWIGISEKALAVLLRWLTKASLEQFFAVVDEMVAPNNKHMWDARKKFWRSYYDRGVMQEAWVVLGRRGVRYIRNLTRSSERLDFGVFKSGSVQDSTQAVLIMRIGSLIVADWNHNGACHIWPESYKGAPKLYENEYTRLDLITGSKLRQVHTPNVWQRHVSEFILDETGIGNELNEDLRRWR